MKKFSWLFLVFISTLFADVEYNGKLYNDETVAEMITVITTTNPIPSIPHIIHIYPTQKSLSIIPAFSKCKKIIVFDGIQPRFIKRKKDYDEYKRRIAALTRNDPDFKNTELIFCSQWVHLAGAIKEAFKKVTTPYVFIHQHDFLLQKFFDLPGVIATMEKDPNVKYVRLSKNKHNYDSKVWDTQHIDYNEGFVPLTKVFGWSDNDHIATSEYYRDFILPACGHQPMEDAHQPAFKEAFQKNGEKIHPIWGTYLYGTLSDGAYIKHTDGRNR